ncbi:hypothetical protein JTB14_032366 [Gonioctena quinquepunctata]|nr:hypothetical protein JTB14_032366 [Gonioctena quinquepunctata]
MPSFEESSDTESADGRLRKKRDPLKWTTIFQKNDEMKPHSEGKESPVPIPETEHSPPPADEHNGLVYAELDLMNAELKPVIRNNDEKTEYAEIIYTQNCGNGKDTEDSPKQ